MKSDVVVIGSGLGGLACAMLMAREGARVVVLEQGAQPGGSLQSYRRHGLDYDTGLHYVGGLGEGQSLRPVFERLGLMQLPWQRLDADGFDRIHLGDRCFCFAEGFEAFAATLAHDFPAERDALHSYAQLLQHPTPDLMAVSAHDYLTAHFRAPLLPELLAATALKTEARADTLPLLALLHCQAPYVESSWRLRGSGRQVVDALVSGLQEADGEVLCHRRVVALEHENRQVVAARCADGETIEGETFVSSLHPSATCLLLSPALGGVYPRRIAALRNTDGMLTVSLRLKPRRLRYFNYNHYVYASSRVWRTATDDAAPQGVMVGCRVPDDGEWARQVDLLTPSPWSHWQQWAHTTRGQRPEAYAEAKRQWADACVRLAARAIPELADVIDELHVSTPLTWQHYTLTPEGAAFGVRKDWRRPLQTMLSVRTPLNNLLLTGQSLQFPGLQGVAMTALKTVSTWKDMH